MTANTKEAAIDQVRAALGQAKTEQISDILQDVADRLNDQEDSIDFLHRELNELRINQVNRSTAKTSNLPCLVRDIGLIAALFTAIGSIWANNPHEIRRAVVPILGVSIVGALLNQEK